jgi:hypothetical protein
VGNIKGGAIILAASDSESLPSPSHEETSRDSSIERYFQKCVIANNTSPYGGAIFIDSSRFFNPSFGAGTVISGNHAQGYGGGLYIKEYLSPVTLLFETVFDKYGV